MDFRRIAEFVGTGPPTLWFAFLFSLPVCFLASYTIHQQESTIALTSRERIGLGYVTRNAEVVHELRGLRSRIVIDRRTGNPERRRIESALSDLYAYNSTAGRDLELTKRLARLQGWWSSIDHGSPTRWQLDGTVGSAVRLFSYIDERSDLNADPEPSSSVLIDALGTQIPALSERLDTANLILVGGLRRGGMSQGQRVEAASLIGQARWAYALALSDVRAAAESDRSLDATLGAPMAQLGARLKRFGAATKGPIFGDASGTVSLARLRDRADDLATSAFAAHSAIAGETDRMLQNRLREGQLWVFAILGIALGFFVIMIVTTAQMLRTHWHRDRAELRHAQEAAERLSAELAKQRALEALSLSEAQFRAVFDGSPTGVALLGPDGSLLKANQALLDMFDPVDPAKIGAAHPAFTALINGRRESFATEVGDGGHRGDGRWFDVAVSLVRDDDGFPLFAMSMVKDVTERKRSDDRLRYDASHDALSGLPNRAFFFEALSRTHREAAARSGHAAVLFVDLDEFKFINDSLGHAVGDRVLVAAAARLAEAAGPGDVVARLGGDEFAILTRVRPTTRQVETFVERIHRALTRPLRVDGRDIFVTASIGVALVDSAYRAVEDILRDADTAMYHAKATGRSRHAFFTTAMHAQARRRLDVATQLRDALEREEFHLAYQPVVSLASGTVEAFEALLRWDHPELGAVPPAEFIPIAEDIGLIVPIGRFVLDRACRQLVEWRMRAENAPAIRLNVNASVREIVQSDYATYLARVVAEYQLRPGELVIEVTESGILTSGKMSENALRRIKMAGVGLSIDDFGTGYSSLRYLQQFPFDELKIDRSFVAGPNGNLASEAIVTMLLSLAKALGVDVVAEGVETAAQASRLRALGCTRAQGYFYGVPTRAMALGDVLEQRRRIAM